MKASDIFGWFIFIIFAGIVAWIFVDLHKDKVARDAARSQCEGYFFIGANRASEFYCIDNPNIRPIKVKS